MNRSQEYTVLLNELENTPPALEYTLQRADARINSRRRIRRFIAVPASSLVAFFAAFVLMVNVSAAFASAVGRIPLLRELALAVSFSPSLSAMIDNEFVQTIGLEQTENEITMRIEYLIVDQKQLNIFYTVDSPVYSHMDVTPSINAPDGAAPEGYSISSGSFGVPNGELRQFTVDFHAQDVPSRLDLNCRVHDNGSDTMTVAVKVDHVSDPAEYAEPAIISTFTFPLSFDPTFTQQGEVIELNQAFVLDGQTLTASTVEIYPTHVRLNLEDAEGNTAWLKSLDFYLEDEKGNRFEKIGNGITATGTVDSPMMASYRLESSFFSVSKSLTIYITGATWLDKDMERVKIDLVGKSAQRLPEGVLLEDAKRQGDDWHLTFSAQSLKENSFFDLFGQDYYDEVGNAYSYNSWSSGSFGHFDDETQKYVETDRFRMQFALTGYPYDIVYLSPAYSRFVTLDTPIVINVK